MEIEGYREHASKEPPGELVVYISDEVHAYLVAEGVEGGRNRRHVGKVDIILKRLRREGMQVRAGEQFKFEGRFPSGRRKGGEQAVYVAKSDQVRIYGGPITVGGKTILLFPEPDTKKRNKADQALLKRVAKSLGEKNDELG